MSGPHSIFQCRTCQLSDCDLQHVMHLADGPAACAADVVSGSVVDIWVIACCAGRKRRKKKRRRRRRRRKRTVNRASGSSYMEAAQLEMAAFERAPFCCKRRHSDLTTISPRKN
jgi:hypothetical protein